MGYYKTAQICLNGHIVNDNMEDYPEDTSNYCSKCGQTTIQSCKSCDNRIKGYYEIEGVANLSLQDEDKPLFCYNCGIPYPWTLDAINTFKELAFLMEKLSTEEQEMLASTIEDLISDSPKTKLAIFNIKKIANKLSEETWGIMRDIIVNVGTEYTKKQLGI